VTDVLLIVILVAFFALAIGLVQVLSRMIERGNDPDALAEEPPDTGDASLRWPARGCQFSELPAPACGKRGTGLVTCSGQARPSALLGAQRGAQRNDLCSAKTRFSRPIAASTIRFRHGVETAAL